MFSQPAAKGELVEIFFSSEQYFNHFKELFTRVGEIPNDHKVTHFHSSFESVQAKGTSIPLHLLSDVIEELKRMETEGHLVKLEKCDKDCFS